MLRNLALVSVILTSGAVAAPRPPAERPDHVERDWTSSTTAGWESWKPSPYTSTYYPPSTTQVVTPSPTTQSTISTTAPISSSPSPLSSAPYASASAIGPCGSVSELVAAFTNISPTAIPTVPAQLAYECLNSIPFNQSDAVALLDSIDPYLEWQTTFEYLKDPPAKVSHSSIPTHQRDLD